ncbi:linalool dehydratase/isomerase domain-containing protein [Nocardia aurea]|uniref:linalool dehydratase/isomerase domain-containing protein n=1 Tax=Nocardia aurea TaxID=2144174 RepID=UPI000D68BBA7|nr:hypothetical protein [Nocardia aurea]
MELKAVFAVVDRLSSSAWVPVVAPLLTTLLAGMKHPEIDKQHWADRMFERSLEIPIADHATGPMSRARQRRLLAVLGSTQAVGLLAAASSAPPWKKAFATGMMLPGVGFLQTRDHGRFAATLVAFAFSLLLWFGAGGMALPPLVWVTAAALAAKRAAGGRPLRAGVPWGVAAAVLLVGIEQLRLRRRTHAAQVEQARAANTLLAQATPPLRGDARPAVHAAGELGLEELALTRRFVDMAFQEPGDWSNWTVIDQFQPAALRYQIDAMINALALQRYSRNPSATAYLDEAQRRLIERYQQKKVWGYWALENLWGNLEWDPDPGKKQNIMMTGYFALSLGLYQTVSGDLSHSHPGAIAFEWSRRRRYQYSLGELCAALTADYVRSPWGLVVCEPNWIFSLCNLRGGTALRVHDRVHGTNFWDQIKDGYVRGFEQELVRPDGMVNAYRSSRAGFGQLGVVSATDLRPLLPHVADRGYVLLRTACGEPGSLRTPFADEESLLDPGNYSFHPLTAYAALMEEGREAGDEELFTRSFEELKERAAVSIDERGWLTVEGASILAHTLLGRALFGRQGGWLDLIEKGMPETWATGPILESVPYPRVMIARAVSDGADLSVVLRSTDAGSREEIGLARLRPGGRYTVHGAVESDGIADEQGRLTLLVDVERRREIRVVPQ